MNDSDRRITELDGIRGLAALGVVVYHYHKHFDAAPWDALLFPVYRGGLLFVDLFFVLSGFVLAQVYAHEGRYPSRWPAIVSRIARLYPLHLLTLLVVAVLQKLHVTLTGHCFIYVYDDWRHLALNLLMLNESGLQRGFSFNGPSWSISTEFIVNIVFLMVALRSPRRATVLGVMLITGMILLDAGLHWTEPARWIEPFNRLFRCFISFGAGLILRGGYEHVPWKRAPQWCVEVLLAGAVAAMLYFMSRPAQVSAYYALSLAVFPAIIALSPRSRVMGEILRARPVVHLGEISFSIYLLHFPLELFYRNVAAITGLNPVYSSPLTLIAFLTICVAVSHAVWKYYEMPARRWIRRLGGARVIRGPIAVPVKH